MAEGAGVKTFTVDEAFGLFNSKREVSVLFGDPDRPEVVVDFFNDRMLTEVSFLDEFQRRTLLYRFGAEKVDDNSMILPESGYRVFHKQAVQMVWDEDARLPGVKARDWTQFHFKRDGRIHIVREIGGVREEAHTELPAEVRDVVLWETFPEFGQRDSLIRMQRDEPLRVQ